MTIVVKDGKGINFPKQANSLNLNGIFSPVYMCFIREYSGSVVECLTLD